MTVKLSKFDEWFKAQFGALPLPPKDRMALDRTAVMLREKLAQILSGIDKDDKMIARYQAARYGYDGADAIKTEAWKVRNE